MGWFDELSKVTLKKIADRDKLKAAAGKAGDAKAKKALYDQLVVVEKEIDGCIAKFPAARKLDAEDIKKTFKTLGF